MKNFDVDGSDAKRNHSELAELKQSLQFIVDGATSGELVSAAADLDDEQAALLLRLTKHFSSAVPKDSVAADGHVIPDRVGRFKILREIGSGGFGVVYLAWDEAIGREVAIKLPRRDLMRDISRREQLVHEARTAGSLDHPLIIPIYESGFDTQTVYIASAYCSGPDLGHWQALQAQPPSPIEAASFVSKLSRAVAYAHIQGVIHRDIKPSNILLASVSDVTSAGSGPPSTAPSTAPSALGLSAYQPRLTDFGLAKLSDEPITDARSSLIVGTPLYMAPEQILPDLGPVTPQTDIYSLGIVLAELLIGSPLLSGKTYIQILGILQSESPAIEQLVPQHIPHDLRRIITKCLSRTPEQRFHSAAASADDLDSFVAGRPISIRSSVLWDRTLAWCRDARQTREACIFVLCSMAFMTLWVLFSMSLLWGSSFSGQDKVKPTMQAWVIICTLHLPIAASAYLGLGGGLRPMVAAAVPLLVGHVFLAALIILELIGLFDSIYDTFPYFKKTTHALVLLIGQTQLLYLSVGIYAHGWNLRRYLRRNPRKLWFGF